MNPRCNGSISDVVPSSEFLEAFHTHQRGNIRQTFRFDIPSDTTFARMLGREGLWTMPSIERAHRIRLRVCNSLRMFYLELIRS